LQDPGPATQDRGGVATSELLRAASQARFLYMAGQITKQKGHENHPKDTNTKKTSIIILLLCRPAGAKRQKQKQKPGLSRQEKKS
jgi:hypothetical protein